MAFNIDDYVDVASRIQEFYAKFPDGRLVTRRVELHVGGALVSAEAYRAADDPHPGVGTAWEPIPGKTSFTKDSEVQNAETAAWGRAIIAVGIPSKKIASADEVKARQPEAKPEPVKRQTAAQKRIVIAATKHGIEPALRYRITRMFTGVTSSKDVPAELCDRVVENINWYAQNPEAGLKELEKWEAKQNITAAA